ncbi:MAG TPA: hypothetical protein VF556_08590 [Pyrinomonadaceae bacterium]|jgi:hypothetical protein
MPDISTNLVAAELQVRTALRDKIQALPGAGTWHTRDRDALDLNEYKKLLKFVDALSGNRQTVRGGFVKFVGFNPSSEDGSMCRTPLKVIYEIEFVMEFEDERKNNTNSSDDFTALQLRFYDLIDRDSSLGINGFNCELPTLANDSEVELFDDFDAHLCSYRLECVLYGG